MPGLREINGFAMYVLGFQTGFNSEAEGVAIFSPPLVQLLPTRRSMQSNRGVQAILTRSSLRLFSPLQLPCE